MDSAQFRLIKAAQDEQPRASIMVKLEQPTAETDAENSQGQLSLYVLQAAPPWLVSFIVHAIVLIILALILVPLPRERSLRIRAIFAEHLGDQLDEETFHLAPQPLERIEQQLVPVEQLPPVDDAMAAPPDLEISAEAISAASKTDAPTIGFALAGREKGFKKALLAAYGGNATTEAAVQRGLEWLKRNQHKDGSWSLAGPYEDGAQVENKTAATAMALLAFQGAGNTHQSGEFKDQVAKGWHWLLKQQNKDGDFWKQGQYNHRLYSQAQATIAICELYGMARDPAHHQPAQRAINFAVSAQSPEGGWRYYPGRDSDTSVTGWFVMALQSAIMADLAVPSPTLEQVSKFLDSVASQDGSLYAYQPTRPPTAAMTAEGLLCRQYLGWNRADARLIGGVAHVLANPIDWNQQNVYYWYYATQVTHHMEGEAWEQWNDVMRQTIPQHQVAGGKEAGSWSPTDDQWGMFGGRLYTTCLCICMLEVYYRHLPIYSPIYHRGLW